MIFTGKDGRKPSTEARRYVYRMLLNMLSHDNEDPHGWLWGGIEDDFDRRRLKIAIGKVKAELTRKVNK